MKVADMHCDTIGELYQDHQRGGKASIWENRLHIDLQILPCSSIWGGQSAPLNMP